MTRMMPASRSSRSILRARRTAVYRSERKCERHEKDVRRIHGRPDLHFSQRDAEAVIDYLRAIQNKRLGLASHDARVAFPAVFQPNNV